MHSYYIWYYNWNYYINYIYIQYITILIHIIIKINKHRYSDYMSIYKSIINLSDVTCNDIYRLYIDLQFNQ